jgi:hypothetical protein
MATAYFHRPVFSGTFLLCRLMSGFSFALLAQRLGLYDWSVRLCVSTVALERKELEGSNFA